MKMVRGGGGGRCESKGNSDFEAKIRGANSVSGERQHDFEIICPARGMHLHPTPPFIYACINELALIFILIMSKSVSSENFIWTNQQRQTKETHFYIGFVSS